MRTMTLACELFCRQDLPLEWSLKVTAKPRNKSMLPHLIASADDTRASAHPPRVLVRMSRKKVRRGIVIETAPCSRPAASRRLL